MKFAEIDQALADLKRGRFIIVVDDENRENEGDLVIAAEHVTSQKINYMLTHARGILCLAVSPERLEQLNIPLMVKDNTDRFNTPFTVSIDYKHGTTTGVSASDRAATIKAVIDPKSRPDDFVRPGHLFPLKASKDGVLGRQGHTEAAVDLCRLAGLYPAAAIAELMNKDGSMSKLPELIEFSGKKNINIISIKDLVAYIKR